MLLLFIKKIKQIKIKIRRIKLIRKPKWTKGKGSLWLFWRKMLIKGRFSLCFLLLPRAMTVSGRQRKLTLMIAKARRVNLVNPVKKARKWMNLYHK